MFREIQRGEGTSLLSLARVELVCDLDGGAAGAAASDAGIIAGASLDVVEVSQVAAEDERRDEGQKKTQQAVKDPALTHPLSVRVALAREAARATEACENQLYIHIRYRLSSISIKLCETPS